MTPLTTEDMGRKRQRSGLDVYLGSSKIGQYLRAPNGATSFRYDPGWLNSPKAFPISLSLPLSDRIWSGDVVASYFDGLLPDSQTVRDRIATREQAASAGVFDLLAAIGRDCVGALRFVPEGEDPGDPATMKYRPVSDDEIAERLAALATHPLGLQGNKDDFRISIAGVQEKTAFLRVKDQWTLPLGTTPTSHIFKPAMRNGPAGADFSDTPWNEWLCLKLCRALGLQTANAEVHDFGEKPVIIVERFDRIWRNGILYRLPQEDLCQALGAPPQQKYQSDGGPGIIDIMKVLNGAIAPREDRIAFMKAQVVFWLLAAIDGHAKNFSLFLGPDGYSLTPLYDVISVAPYPQFPIQKTRLAMAFGNNNHYRLAQIQPRHFRQTGRKAGLSDQETNRILSELIAGVDKAVSLTAATAAEAGMPESTYAPILNGVDKRSRIMGDAGIP